MEKTVVKSNRGAASLLHGVGRRKSSVARVWLKPGKGLIEVNGKDYQNYFDTDISKDKVVFPFKVTNLEKKYNVQVNVAGGGLKSQAEAVRLGISRALLVVNEALKPALKKNGLLSVDSRLKERKKYGQKAARRKFQFVKR
ncbi:MAG: 30S ribosomal protein S9 [candidate division TM6 bacterium GW2011_GWF2_37_49]|nr:MAG: 30S ribosomal protein S9 [candidate division TM6 bacterium GW2011_GWF2_37_49]